MEDRSPSSSNTAERGDTAGNSKQAACLNCRRSKTRCLRDTGDAKCKKCFQTDLDCVIPEYRVGRKKGIKNKRDGLEKAVHRIEQAIKRHKTNAHHPEDGQTVQQLQGLLHNAQNLLPRNPSDDAETSFQMSSHLSQPERLSRNDVLGHVLPGSAAPVDQNSDDHFAVDDAENPLQLLARASDLSVPARAAKDIQSIPSAPAALRMDSPKDHTLRDFFGPFRPSLDVEKDIDPIEMGLVTQEETDALFTHFHKNLSHTRWGLDPVLHTPQFVQRQSAFLFTSILAASALFIPTAASISKRLSAHVKFLARNIIARRHRSPEIVLGFMINIPWMPPGAHWSDDETCAYMATAVTIAMDCSLDKLIVPSPTGPSGNFQTSRAQSEHITARKALDMDGFRDVDPFSDYGRRLLRRRERIWLALFILDRGVCLARGRSFIMSVTPLVETCDNWHRCSIADRWDGSVVSTTVLRRDLVDLISEVKKSCNSNRAQGINGSIIVQSLQQMIDGFFNRWYATWAFAIGGTEDDSVPPYVEILVTHGRLSIYSSVINLPTAPVEVKRFFRAAGLSSSLNVMRAAVQGESALQSLPNNTCIMISFAACFAIYLSTMGAGRHGHLSLAPSIRILIEESAGVLERIGSTPPHRNGTSALYGRHLREVVGSLLSRPSNIEQLEQSDAHPRGEQYTQGSYTIEPPIHPQSQGPQIYSQQLSIAPRPAPTTVPVPSELLQFSAMSDDQINQAIQNAGDEFDWSLSNFQMDEHAGLDWLNWFNLDV